MVVATGIMVVATGIMVVVTFTVMFITSTYCFHIHDMAENDLCAVTVLIEPSSRKVAQLQKSLWELLRRAWLQLQRCFEIQKWPKKSTNPSFEPQPVLQRIDSILRRKVFQSLQWKTVLNKEPVTCVLC